MKKLVLALIVLALCSVSFAQDPSLKKIASHQQEAASPSPFATLSCSVDLPIFVSGANNTYLRYCLTDNGNIPYFESPVGHQQIWGPEGYGLCDTSTATAYYDYAYLDSGNWGAPTIVSQTDTVVKIARTTGDDAWTLTQTFTQVASTSLVKVAMALKNNTNTARGANLVRYVYAAPDGVAVSNYDGTQNSAFAWNSIGSGDHPFGLLLQNVGTSVFGGYNGFAQTVPDGPPPCNYAANFTGGVGVGIQGSLVMVYVGSVPAHKTKTFTMSYKGL